MREEECLIQLKTRIKEQECLQDFNSFINDEFLLYFIRGRKYRVDYALDTLKQYFYVRRTKYKSFFMQILPSNLKIKHCLGQPLKHLGPDGQVIVFFKREWFPPLDLVHSQKLTVDQGLQKVVVMAEEMMKNPDFNVNGFEMIFDLSNLALADVIFVLHFNAVMKLITLFHKAFPLRTKKVHLVNPPKYIKLILNFTRPLDPAGYLGRVYSHFGDLKTLHKHFPKKILPKALKGEIPDEDAFDEEFDKRCLRNDEPFIKLQRHLKTLD